MAVIQKHHFRGLVDTGDLVIGFPQIKYEIRTEHGDTLASIADKIKVDPRKLYERNKTVLIDDYNPQGALEEEIQFGYTIEMKSGKGVKFSF